MSRCIRLAVGVAAALLAGAGAAAADPPGLQTLPIDAAAPDFKLPGVDGREYSLRDFAADRLLVVLFTCNHCPTAQAYEDRIIKLHADYKDKGVALVAISPNDPKAVRLDELGYTDLGDSFEDMKVRAKQRKFAFPYLPFWRISRSRSNGRAFSAARPSGPTSARTPRRRWRNGTRSLSPWKPSTRPASPGW